MSVFPKPTKAPVPRSTDAPRIAIFFAGLIVIMVVAQLFTFEHFLELLTDFSLPGGDGSAYIIAAILVAAEVLAIPFLLRMRLSRPFRFFSMGCGWLLSLVWVFLSSWVVLTEQFVDSVGFLGTTVNLMPGWWAIFVSLSLVILSIWTSWGLWPGRARK